MPKVTLTDPEIEKRLDAFLKTNGGDTHTKHLPSSVIPGVFMVPSTLEDLEVIETAENIVIGNYQKDIDNAKVFQAIRRECTENHIREIYDDNCVPSIPAYKVKSTRSGVTITRWPYSYDTYGMCHLIDGPLTEDMAKQVKIDLIACGAPADTLEISLL